MQVYAAENSMSHPQPAQQVSKCTGANWNNISVCKIMTKIVLVHEITINIAPLHEIIKTHCFNFKTHFHSN